MSSPADRCPCHRRASASGAPAQQRRHTVLFTVAHNGQVEEVRELRSWYQQSEDADSVIEGLLTSGSFRDGERSYEVGDAQALTQQYSAVA